MLAGISSVGLNSSEQQSSTALSVSQPDCLFCNMTGGDWWVDLLRPGAGVESFHASDLRPVLLGTGHGNSEAEVDISISPPDLIAAMEQEALDDALELPRAASLMVLSVRDRLKPSPEQTDAAKAALRRAEEGFKSAK